MTPGSRVAPATPPRELERLALEEAAYPDTPPLAVQTVIWLFRAYNAANSAVAAALRPLDLSPSAFNVLQSLVNTPGNELEPCHLADRLLISRPSVTGLIDTLEAKGLVSRRPHEQDRRRVLVGLTATARTLLEQHGPDHSSVLRTITADLSEDEMATLVTLLRRVPGAAPPDLQD